MRASALRSTIATVVLMAVPFTSGRAIPDSGSSSSSSSNTNSLASATSPGAETVRILVCGDSISQGKEGDFTWRYRLWEWFHNNSESNINTPSTTTPPPARPPQRSSSSSPTSSSNADGNNNICPTLQYVGPYNGTLPAAVDAKDVDPTNPQTWGTYNPTVSPLFSPGGGSSHFAVYGRPAWQDIEPLPAQVTTYAPDIVVLHLGFNDIGWWGNNATDLILSVQRLVFNARLARPGVKVLIADVSHRLAIVGREDVEVTTNQYNALLDEKAAEWWTLESPVEVVKVSEVYDCHPTACPAGIDGLHPNSLGDFQIARAYTKVLHEKFHYGTAPLEVPPADTIPGFVLPPSSSSSSSKISSTSGGGGSSLARSPPVSFLAAGAALLSLLFVAALRPEWGNRLRRGRFGLGSVMKVQYHLLPSR